MSEFINGATHIEMDESILNNAKVKVFGVGGAGGNTVNRMVGMNIEGVEYYAVNTDAKALELSLADHKIQIGKKLTKALGAGMKPEVGRKAAEENIEELKEAMKGADMIFITAGMGGGTGTGAAPVVGNVAREMGILTVAVVTKPFKFEGKRRGTLASEGIANLRTSVDTMIVVDNEKLMNVVQNTDKALTLDGAFKLTDEILGNAVRSICDIMFRHGLIHVDFADIKTVMTNGGSALMGTGIAEGEGRGIRATDMALSSPLLEDINVDGATGVLVNVSHGENFSMLEYNEAMEHIHEAVSDKNDPNIIMGDILLPELGDKVCITIIATGCGNTGYQQPAAAQVAPVQVAPQQPYTAPAPRASDLVNTIGGPAAGYQQAAPQQPQPVAATPRPTALNFVALAQTVPMPTIEVPSAQQSVFTQHGAQPAVTGFAAPGFSATAPAEETILGTPNASLPETQEFSAAADVDIMNTVSDKPALAMQEEPSLETPTFIRNTMAEKSIPAAVTASHDACALRSSGVDYDVPAFLRGSDVF